jgi:hypothetical protein
MFESTNAMTLPDPVLCHRCGAELTPGKGNFYVVCIEAFADPSPPIISAEDLKRDMRREMQRLIRELRDKSEQELMDQVYRRLVIHLCSRCYPEWIEHPAG